MFLRVYVKVIIAPEPDAGFGFAVMTNVSRAPTYVVTVAETEFELTVAAPNVAEAVAIFVTDPSSRSVCEIMRVPVQVVVPPGAIAAPGLVHVIPVALSSVTVKAG